MRTIWRWMRGIGYVVLGLGVFYIGAVEGLVNQHMKLGRKLGNHELDGVWAVLMGLVCMGAAPMFIYFAYKLFRNEEDSA